MSSLEKPKIFVIILNYNGEKDLLKTIQSVVDSDYHNLEIVLVDNNSSDDSLNLAKQNFPQIHFIENEKNFGFGAGNNIGIKYAFENGADFVFLLNNDALVQKNTISNLIDSIKNEENFGLVSPVIYSDLDYKKIWFCGGKINWLKMRAEHYNSGKVQECLNPTETEYVTGCAMLISREVFEKVGLFDEKFFLYYEDADLSLRANKVGLKNLVVSNSKVYHAEKSEENQPQKIYWLVLSGIYFFKKNAKGFWKIYLSMYLSLRKFKNFLDVKFRPNDISLVVRKAYGDFER